MFKKRQRSAYLFVHGVHCVHFSSCSFIIVMDESPYTQELKDLILKEFPHLNQVTYLDHAGASLYAKSQIDDAFKELNQNLLCNPHTNFGNLKVSRIKKRSLLSSL